jgi:hypothetical protein
VWVWSANKYYLPIFFSSMGLGRLSEKLGMGTYSR